MPIWQQSQFKVCLEDQSVNLKSLGLGSFSPSVGQILYSSVASDWECQ